MEGTYAYLWLSHVDIWQKPTKFSKAIILWLKNTLVKNKQKKNQVINQLLHMVTTAMKLKDTYSLEGQL